MNTSKIFKFLFLATIPLINISCQGEKKNIDGIEIIADYDSGYLTASEVDKKPEAKEISAIVKEVVDELKPNNVFAKTGAGEYVFLYELYLNEKGAIDKVRIIEGMGESFDKQVIHQIKGWKFDPAKKNNKDVKSRFILYSKFNFDMKGGWQLTWSFDIIGNKLTTTSGDFYYTMVDEMPVFPGGDMALMKFLAGNIIYPEESKKAGIEGKVYVKLYVDETGNISATEVLKGIDKNLDEAAVSAVKKLKFIPGKQSGKPVKVWIVIPISFKLS